VAATLRSYTADRDVTYWGLGALLTLAASNNDNKTRLGRAGGCELVAGALRTYRADRDILLYGLEAIER
jgi:hypothetical protein